MTVPYTNGLENQAIYMKAIYLSLMFTFKERKEACRT